MPAADPDPDPDLAALAAEFPGWDFGWWLTGTARVVRGRRRPVTAFSEWVLRETADEARQEIMRREQEPPERSRTLPNDPEHQGEH